MFALAISSLALVGGDTILKRDFCQKYWAGEASACAAVKARVVVNHSRVLPTLTLGDPGKPAMFFVHGWPDNGAEWANLFGAFCETYFCVAPTLTNFHPDLPFVSNRSELGLGAEVDKLAAVAQEMGLANLTLVAHDWGSVFGYIFAVKYPALITRVVQFDIGGMVQFNPPEQWVYAYQHEIISAWDHQSALRLLPFAVGVPNVDMLYWEAAWPYVCLWSDGNDTVSWRREAYPGVTKWGNWAFNPVPLEQPILFFWGDCQDPSCAKPRGSELFFDKAWLPYLNSTKGDLGVRVHANHWIYVYNRTGVLPLVISTMNAWLASAMLDDRVDDVGIVGMEARRPAAISK